MITKAIQVSRIKIAGPGQFDSWVVGVSFTMPMRFMAEPTSKQLEGDVSTYYSKAAAQ